MRRPIRPRLETLESRTTPARMVLDAGKVLGDFSLPHTTTEIMASIRSTDAIAELGRINALDPRGAALIDPAASAVIFTMGGNALVQVDLTAGADPALAARWLAAHGQVVWTAPNTIFVGDPYEFTPNDPQYASQYHLPKMGLPTAWNTQTGSPSIVVGIADDGLAYNHPDLNDNIWNNSDEISGNGVDDDGNGFIDDIRGWDFDTNDNNPIPTGSNTHGTHVGGIVAAETNNATGVAGVAGGNGTVGSGVRLMPIRWIGGSWTAAKVANTYTYAANNGAKIVNASYNFDGWASDATVTAALNFAYAQGVLLMNSAGNSNQNNPARQVFTQTLMVASTDANDIKSSFSNYGTFADIAAPGSNVLATLTGSGGTTFSYGLQSGTSMSAPNAAAVAALIWSQNPTWTREQVVAQMLATADNIDAQNPGFVGLLGTGRANAARALSETIPAPKFGTITGLPAAATNFQGTLTSFSIIQNLRFDPATVIGGNFEMRGDGADGVFFTSDDVLKPLTINSGTPYRVGTNLFSFTVAGMSPDRYRFIAKSGAGGLRNPFGTAFDGDGNGVGGDNFVREFGYQLSPGTVTVDVGSGQSRSRVEQVVVSFGQVVTFQDNNPEAAFSLTKIGAGAVNLDATVATVGGQTVVTLTFLSGTEFGSLTDGRYTLAIDNTRIRDSLQNQIPAVAATNFHRFFGDVNGDANVDIADFGLFSGTYNLEFGQTGYLDEFDYNNDGRIDIADFGQFSLRYFTMLP